MLRLRAERESSSGIYEMVIYRCAWTPAATTVRRGKELFSCCANIKVQTLQKVNKGNCRVVWKHLL